jgi:hypothetical protein
LKEHRRNVPQAGSIADFGFRIAELSNADFRLRIADFFSRHLTTTLVTSLLNSEIRNPKSAIETIRN